MNTTSANRATHCDEAAHSGANASLTGGSSQQMPGRPRDATSAASIALHGGLGLPRGQVFPRLVLFVP